MSIYETSITNPRKQLEFYKDLSEPLQRENDQLRLINKEHQQINGELRQANKLLNEQYIRLYKDYERLKDNWNKLKEYISKNIIYDDVGMKILDPSPLEDKIVELERGVSDVSIANISI